MKPEGKRRRKFGEYEIITQTLITVTVVSDEGKQKQTKTIAKAEYTTERPVFLKDISGIDFNIDIDIDSE